MVRLTGPDSGARVYGDTEPAEGAGVVGLVGAKEHFSTTSYSPDGADEDSLLGTED